MINAQRNSSRKRFQNRSQHTVWAEPNKRGGYIIYAGIRGTESKTIAGGATCRDTLDYNIRKAKTKFGIKI